MVNLFNYILAFFLLIFLTPLLIFIVILIILTSGFPIFFIQERIGYKNKIFKIIKFRTMIKNNISDETRNITNIGKFLRRYSIDEIPNLFNVLKGEMNIVGPRPLLVEYLDKYTSNQLKRHDVKPGITGLAQIRGRNKIDWEQKFKSDLEYVETRSIFLDIRIIFKTFSFLIFNSNNYDENIIAKRFKGKE